MSSSKIAIIDYGFGNIHSISKALEFIGQDFFITKNPRKISTADGIIIPGVGAFGDAMSSLKKNNLIDPIKKYIQSQKPILGICLGMQLLLSISREFGTHNGLDIISGNVLLLPKPKSTKDYKIPYIGWNNILKPNHNSNWSESILKNIPEKNSFYFIHSYAVYPNDKNYILAYAKYGNHLVPAALKKDNIYGCQFHPEKSRSLGLSILKNFSNIVSSIKL